MTERTENNTTQQKRKKVKDAAGNKKKLNQRKEMNDTIRQNRIEDSRNKECTSRREEHNKTIWCRR